MVGGRKSKKKEKRKTQDQVSPFRGLRKCHKNPNNNYNRKNKKKTFKGELRSKSLKPSGNGGKTQRYIFLGWLDQGRRSQLWV